MHIDDIDSRIILLLLFVVLFVVTIRLETRLSAWLALVVLTLVDVSVDLMVRYGRFGNGSCTGCRAVAFFHCGRQRRCLLRNSSSSSSSSIILFSIITSTFNKAAASTSSPERERNIESMRSRRSLRCRSRILRATRPRRTSNDSRHCAFLRIAAVPDRVASRAARTLFAPWTMFDAEMVREPDAFIVVDLGSVGYGLDGCAPFDMMVSERFNSISRGGGGFSSERSKIKRWKENDVTSLALVLANHFFSTCVSQR